ncbi:hypothetical protein Z517_11715 [Fonsecaea pedrosoi CBS 271.37]|uniref:Azaphilone pigments biosynthesis cluster protein L N-terminal domain-containing protein n=1 Tax=Fonsecaea pedrosoi CBS 271.37 TaxID=1442368 RepID=A0A0D2GR85_9EURO|nr:uncharacterized protein Z517_11715 [Fonsecaea pedrosoi CBS 271.37]KIW74944.1 hypothetical protein Z517_11715 [Fonsecaea pedrosoi CBS 271.37]
MPIEPLTITVACSTLISNVGKASVQIYSFVSRVRDAHRDLDAVLKELSSLGLCLETLRNDAMVTSKRVPQPLENRVLLVLVNTAEVVKEMREMLDNLSSDRFGNQMKWAIYGQSDMNKLRSRLESHKAALEIALALLTLSLTTAIKDDTSSIRRNVKETVVGLDQIVQVLAALPERVAAQLQVGALNEAAIVDTIRPALQELTAPEAPVENSARTLESLFPPPPMNAEDQTPSNLDAAAAVQSSSPALAVVAAESSGQPVNSTQDQESRSPKWRNDNSHSKLQPPPPFEQVAVDKEPDAPEEWVSRIDRLARRLEQEKRARQRNKEERSGRRAGKSTLREDEVLKWDDSLRPRMTTNFPGAPVRKRTGHPPLGMSQFPDVDDDDHDNRQAPGLFESMQRKALSGDNQVEHGEERPRLQEDDKDNDKQPRQFFFPSFFSGPSPRPMEKPEKWT